MVGGAIFHEDQPKVPHPTLRSQVLRDFDPFTDSGIDTWDFVAGCLQPKDACFLFKALYVDCKIVPEVTTAYPQKLYKQPTYEDKNLLR